MSDIIKTLTLPSITNLKLGTDFNHLYVSYGNTWNIVPSLNIQYVSELPTTGLIDNTFYVTDEGQAAVNVSR